MAGCGWSGYDGLDLLHMVTDLSGGKPGLVFLMETDV